MTRRRPLTLVVFVVFAAVLANSLRYVLMAGELVHFPKSA